jgi:hypothetical protein
MNGVLAVILVAIFVPSSRANNTATPFTASSYQAEDLIRSIRRRYATINRNVPRYKRIKKELSGFSLEGGELAAYFNGRAIMKIVATHYGEMGRASEEYYYWDEKLIFVFLKEYRYDSPLSGKVARTKEDRLYFSDDRLIRWVDESGKQIEPSTSEYQVMESAHLEDSRRFTRAARSRRPPVEAPSVDEPSPTPAT